MKLIFLLITILVFMNPCFAQKINRTDSMCITDLENLFSKNSFIFESEIVEIYQPPELWSESAIFN